MIPMASCLCVVGVVQTTWSAYKFRRCGRGEGAAKLPGFF